MDCLSAGERTLPKKLNERDEHVTCFRLNAFSKEYGWPFDPEDLPNLPKVIASASSMLGLFQASPRPVKRSPPSALEANEQSEPG
jgi:hypothetical protein